MDEWVRHLGVAITLRAIEDWRDLCRGKPETNSRNFQELEQFFKCECELMLHGTDINATAILDRLQRERKRTQIKKRLA